MIYRSTKTYGHDLGLSCAFRQWRADSHCNRLHGYALAVRLVFEADRLDARNWVIDFGGLKAVKSWLVARFDHTTLVAIDDPELSTFRELDSRGVIELLEVPATGCEAFAGMIYRHVDEWLRLEGHAPRVALASVEVMEHGANSAICKRVA